MSVSLETLALAKKYTDEHGGSGSGGTNNYNNLTNKPSINGIELSGNKTSADLNIKSDISIIAHGTSDTTFTLTPNIMHTWGEVSSLNLTLGAESEDIVNEYMFSFISGATATQLTLPATVNGVPAIEPNSIYQCSVIDNCLAYGRWDNNVTV